MSIAHLLNQEGQLYAESGKSRYGREQWGTPISVAMRFQPATKSRMTPSGEVQTIDGVVMFAGDVIVTDGMRLDYGGFSYRVIGIAGRTGADGTVHHYTLEVQKWEI